MNKETLEEAAERLIKLNRQDAFYEGANWQAKRMYSREEVDKLLDSLLEGNMCSIIGDELIEEFKKK